MIKLLGIPYDLNSSYLRGASMAPDRMRIIDREGSANRFSEFGTGIEPGVTYEDCGNLSLAGLGPAEASAHIRSSVSDLITTNNKVLSIGGDHSITYPILDAHRQSYEPLHLLHIDAHGDLYHDFDRNPFSHASPIARIAERKLVDSITQVGIRSMTKHQREQANKFGVHTIEMKDFNADFVNDLKGPLYISLDIDALDPAYAPGVSHQEPGGLSTRQLLTILHSISVDVVGADLVEYNPSVDVQQRTALVGYKLMKELICLMLRQTGK